MGICFLGFHFLHWIVRTFFDRLLTRRWLHFFFFLPPFLCLSFFLALARLFFTASLAIRSSLTLYNIQLLLFQSFFCVSSHGPMLLSSDCVSCGFRVPIGGRFILRLPYSVSKLSPQFVFAGCGILRTTVSRSCKQEAWKFSSLDCLKMVSLSNILRTEITPKKHGAL